MPLALPKWLCVASILFFWLGYQNTSAPISKPEGEQQQQQDNSQPAVTASPSPSVQTEVKQPETRQAEEGRQQQQSPPKSWFSPDGALVLLNFLLLVLIGIQTAIYRNQLREMRKMKGVSERQATIMESQVSSMQGQLGIMQAQTTTMQDSLTETRKMVSQNERAVKASEDSVKVAERSLITSSRAYVGINYIRTVLDKRSVFIKFGNTGKLPADDLKVFIEVMTIISKSWVRDNIRGFVMETVNHDFGHTKLFPIAFNVLVVAPLHHLSGEEITLIAQDKAMLIVRGHAEYGDGFDTTQRSPFSLRYVARDDEWTPYPIWSLEELQQQIDKKARGEDEGPS